MPNSKTHDKITLIASPLIVLGTTLITSNLKIIIIIYLSYLFASLMFNGDLDTNSKPFNRWHILKIIWIPYQLLFSHRSIFTHGIIIGTIVRIIYLITIPFFILLYFKVNLFFSLNFELFLQIIIGLELGSLIHTLSDRFIKF